MYTRKAYTLIEVSIALLIVNTCVLLWIYLFNSLDHFEAKIVERENRIGLVQLRRMIALGKDYDVQLSELCMNFRDDDTCFYEVNNRLIQTPGTQIYLLNVSYVEFSEKDQIITMTYEMNEEIYEEIIGYR